MLTYTLVSVKSYGTWKLGVIKLLGMVFKKFIICVVIKEKDY